ncbi:phage neck terminator protein [Providencia sp. Je.9.19]|uniref:phage neck terminator protein n=1 Tax=Providencia sp. Je.9.19 TaxID=3142844 RepID=UPI003DA7FFE4
MAATISVTERDIFSELRPYLIELFECPVVVGYQNNVALPKDCIVMHMLFERNIDYTANYWDGDTSEITAQNSVEATFQLDFYGSEANSRARVVANLWRSSYTTAKLKKCQPLYCGEPRKNILVNESNQYENRMMLDIKLQYNPETSYQVDSVDSISIETTNI